MLNPVSRLLRFLTSSGNSVSSPGTPASSRCSARRLRRRKRIAASVSTELYEQRLVLSANPAHDLVRLDQLRNDPLFTAVDGDTGTGSSQISVVVIDSGLDGSHRDLVGNFTAYVDFVQDEFTADGQRVVHTQPSASEDPDGHGTHVGGTIGSTNPNIGTAPGVNLIGLRVLGNGQRNSDLTDALEWVMSHRETYRIVAVNMSLGFGVYLQQPADFQSIPHFVQITNIISSLEASGVTVVSAAGNDYFDHAKSPGDPLRENVSMPGISSTLTVGGVWQDGREVRVGWEGGAFDYTTGADRLVSHSQRLSSLDSMLFAPGALIKSTVPGNRYASYGGTSMASPAVTGVVALMQDAALLFGNRLLRPSEVKEILIATADQINDGDDENDNVVNGNNNYRRMNAYRAVQEVRRRVTGTLPPDAPPLPPPPEPPPGQSPDVNGTLSTARVISSLPEDLTTTYRGGESIIGDDTARGIITIFSDVDMFKVTVGSGRLLAQASRSSSNLAPVLRVFNSDGTEIAINGDSAPQTAARISIPVAAGTYYIGVSGHGNSTYSPKRASSGTRGSTGAYNFSVALRTTIPVDPDGVIGGTGVPEYRLSDYSTTGMFQFERHIGLDGTVSVGTWDVDISRIIVDQPTIVTFETFGTPINDTVSWSSRANTFLRLFNSEGLEIAGNDNKPGDTYGASRIDVRLEPGVYYVGVSNNLVTYDPIDLSDRMNGGTTGTGNYRFQVRVPIVQPSDPNGTHPAAVPVSVPVGGRVKITDWIGRDGTADVTGTGDVDLYRFQPITDGTLLVDINTPYGPGFDSVTAHVNTRLRIWQSSLTNGIPGWTELLPASADDPATDFIGDPAEFVSSSYTTDRTGVRMGHSTDSFKRISVARGTTYLIGVSRDSNSTYQLDNFTNRASAESSDLRYDIVLSLGGATGISDVDGSISPGRLTAIDLSGSSVQRSGEIGADSVFVGSTDVDFYRIRFNGSATAPSRILTLDVNVPSGSALDSWILLYDASGNLLASNNDENALETDSLLNVPIQVNTDYYVAVTGAGNEAFSPFVIGSGGGGSTGTYTLTMSTAVPTTTPRGRLAETLASGRTPRSLDLDRQVQGLDLTAADVFAANQLKFISVNSTAQRIQGSIGEDQDAGSADPGTFNPLATAFLQATGLGAGSSVVFDQIGGADVDLYPLRVSIDNYYEISSFRPGGTAGELSASLQMKLYRGEGSLVNAVSASNATDGSLDRQLTFQLAAGDYFLAVLADGSGANKYDFSQQDFSEALSAAELGQMDRNSGPYEIVVQPLSISINSVEVTSSGKLLVNLSQVADPARLVMNSPSGDSNVVPTVIVTGPGGENISGSSIFDAERRQLVCVPLNPYLAPGQYTVHIRQQDFVTTVGNIKAGTEPLSFQFTVPSVPHVMSIPRIMLNPGKAVNIGGATGGLPIRMSDAAGLVDITLRLQYSEDFLSISSAVLAPTMPGGWSIQSFRKLPGQIEVHLKGSTALTAGERELVRLTATVPSTAPSGGSWVNSIDGGGRRADGTFVDFAERNAIQNVGELSPPTILAPAPNIQSQRPQLQWTAVPGAVSYSIWIGNSTTNQQPIHTGQSSTTVYDVPVDLGIGRMDLYLRAVLADGTLLPWTPAYRFQVITSPTIAPLNARQTTALPTVSWSNLTGATSWDVWVSNLTAGGTLAVRTTVTDNFWKPIADLAMARYRIWVRALAAGGFAGAWSVAKDFLIAPSPTVISPTTPTFNSRPNFDWGDVAGATSYAILVRNAATNADVANISGLAASSWSPSFNLPHGDYVWWAIADSTSAGFRSSWTARTEFSVGGRTKFTGPASPALSTTPLLQWLAVDGAVRYELWVNGDTEGAKLIHKTDLSTSSFQVVAPFGSSRTYRMWVRAVSGDGRTAFWSDTYVLRVAQADEVDDDKAAEPTRWPVQSLAVLVKTELSEIRPSDEYSSLLQHSPQNSLPSPDKLTASGSSHSGRQTELSMVASGRLAESNTQGLLSEFFEAAAEYALWEQTAVEASSDSFLAGG